MPNAVELLVVDPNLSRRDVNSHPIRIGNIGVEKKRGSGGKIAIDQQATPVNGNRIEKGRIADPDSVGGGLSRIRVAECDGGKSVGQGGDVNGSELKDPLSPDWRSDIDRDRRAGWPEDEAGKGVSLFIEGPNHAGGPARETKIVRYDQHVAGQQSHLAEEANFTVGADFDLPGFEGRTEDAVSGAGQLPHASGNRSRSDEFNVLGSANDKIPIGQVNLPPG